MRGRAGISQPRHGASPGSRPGHPDRDQPAGPSGLHLEAGRAIGPDQPGHAVGASPGSRPAVGPGSAGRAIGPGSAGPGRRGFTWKPARVVGGLGTITNVAEFGSGQNRLTNGLENRLQREST